MKRKEIGLIILGLIIGLFLGFILSGSINLSSNKYGGDLCSGDWAESTIGNICSIEGKTKVEFVVDVSDKFVMKVDTSNCQKDFFNEYGIYPHGPCLLKDVSSYGEAKVGNAQFLKEYTCICWKN